MDESRPSAEGVEAIARAAGSAAAAHTPRWQEHSLALACLLTCTVVYLFPLISNLLVSIPGTSETLDVTEYVWSVGWFRHALSTHHDLFFTDALFVPLGADLHLTNSQPLQSMMAQPLIGFFGLIGAYNLILVLSFLLNGALTYAFIFSLVKNSAAALLAALCLMLSGALVWHFDEGRLALPALWVLIVVIWRTKALLEFPSAINGIFLGLGLLAATFSDFHILLFSMLWLAMLTIHHMLFEREAATGTGRPMALGIAALLWGIPSGLLYIPAFLAAGSAGYRVPRTIDLAYYSFAPADFVNADYIPAIYGFDFLGIVIAALLIFRWRGPYRFWITSALLLLFLTLGPTLKPFDIPLPLSALSAWAPWTQFRAPYRFVLPALVGWAAVAGYLLARVLPALRSRAWTWGLVLLLAAGRLWYTIDLVPFQVQTPPEYDFYYELAAEPGDFAILEVPFGVRSGLERIGHGGEDLQFYQHIHGKRLLNGSVSRLPSSLFAFYREHPALMLLAGETQTDTHLLAADFADVLSWSAAKYVVVHRSRLSEEENVGILAFLDEQPQLEEFTIEGDLVVYHVK